MIPNVIAFADGENLVLRYQDMKLNGRTPTVGATHIPDLLIWHPLITKKYMWRISRISYYQTVVGDEEKLDQVREQIIGTEYSYSADLRDQEFMGRGFLIPRIFKKQSKSTKTKSVDINLTVDMLRHSTDPQFEVLLLLSGDGDYLPLVEEATRRGKQVWLAAFSKGLNKRLRYAVDEFIDLDSIFFQKD